ncbi:MAG: hypothetical protein FWD11_11505, partial [Micrococcales bacterium]|nr:hypothetical protein [Micrococcales bacterium]
AAAAAAAAVVVLVGAGYMMSSVDTDTSTAPMSGAPPNGDTRQDPVPPTQPQAVSPPVHVAVDLPTTAGTGTVYKLGPPRQVDAERLASAWGVTGPVRATADGWTASDAVRTLRVTQADGLVYVQFADTSATGTSTDEAAARRVLTSAGVDVSALDVTTSGGVTYLRQVVSGKPTSLGWQVELGSSAPARITATLGGAAIPQAPQPLVSPTTAVDRLNSSEFWSWSATMADPSGILTGTTAERVPARVLTVEITDARLGLALDTSSGTPRLVPAYALTSQYGTVLTPALVTP